MAEALVSLLLEQLASIIRTQIEQEVSLIVGVEKDAENLTIHLEAVQAVLQDAEERQVKEASVRNWLDNLKDVSYDISDVVDEWNTEILKQKIETQEKEGENAVNIPERSKVRNFFIPSLRICFGHIGHVSMRRDIAVKIKQVNERLTLIANIRENYGFQRTIRGMEQVERPKTSSYVDISSIIGREDEKDMLISKLLSESSSQEGRGPLVIVPIVGMGGIGKTTLAQLAYNDEKVKTHFDKRIWVCVSNPFEVIVIAKAIIEGLNVIHDNRIDSNELQTLLDCISDSIKGEERSNDSKPEEPKKPKEPTKFLLVLDDVWNPNNTQWEQLKAALHNGAMGSRIVVTTRKKEVAIMIRATTHMIPLAELSEQNCLLIFFHIAFFEKERDEYKMFEDIGKKIVKKCKGLPLAAKTLGSLMRFKKTKKEWQDVLDSKIWELEEVEQEVFQPLLLTYYDLTPAIRRCVLYCATFPKDHEFDKNKLIELWMSHEYLNLKGNKEKETVIGQSIFNTLVMRSFFQDFEKDDDENIIRCKMHDIVHDFVQFLTKNECLILEANNANERNKVLDDKVRHLMLMPASDGSFPIAIYNCGKLRTLACDSEKRSTVGLLNNTTILSSILLQLKCVRTLDLQHSYIKELPKEIGRLIHLRYLDLSRNGYIKKLPDALGDLYNLQTLRLTKCRILETLPEVMRKLINLRHFYVEDSLRLKLPKDFGMLSLQTVDMFDCCLKLGNLRNLDQLQGSLHLTNLGAMKYANEAKEAHLMNKKELVNLNLNFEYPNFNAIRPYANEAKEAPRELDEEILNAIQPHANLETLIIQKYHGTTVYPNWMMSLHSLRRLKLQRCIFCEYLPPLGKLPSLEYLEIDRMDSVKKVGVEFLGLELETQSSISFPRLKQLTFKSMRKWKKWEGVVGWREEGSETTIMPSLSTLHFEECYHLNLNTLPDFLWKTPLQNLSIQQNSHHRETYEVRRGKEWAKISHIPNIKIDREFVQKDGVLIT